jgi:uncharacterized membrane protein
MTHDSKPLTGPTDASCDVCGKRFPLRELVAGSLVRDNVGDEIRKEHPQWSANAMQRICRPDLAHYRASYVHSLLLAEKGELTSLEREVLESLRKQQIVAADVDNEFEQRWSLGERLADHIASFGGSWAFILCFGAFIVVWIMANSLVLYWRPADPYPYILLNLMLSCLAAMQAPVIMMSQNRQETKDRLRARNDYQVNLKAELEIRHLHEKMDHLLSHQWERLVQIQEVQLDLLSELRRPR